MEDFLQIKQVYVQSSELTLWSGLEMVFCRFVLFGVRLLHALITFILIFQTKIQTSSFLHEIMEMSP